MKIFVFLARHQIISSCSAFGTEVPSGAVIEGGGGGVADVEGGAGIDTVAGPGCRR